MRLKSQKITNTLLLISVMSACKFAGKVCKNNNPCPSQPSNRMIILLHKVAIIERFMRNNAEIIKSHQNTANHRTIIWLLHWVKTSIVIFHSKKQNEE